MAEFPRVRELTKTYGQKLRVLLIDLDPRTDASVAAADRKLESVDASYSNALFEGGAEEVLRTLNTQGYGYALVGPDGRTTGTHLTIHEVVDQLAKTLKPASGAAQP